MVAYARKKSGLFAELRTHTDLVARLDRIERKLDSIVGKPAEKDAYTVAEVALIAHRKKYTVRQWCRQGRIHAEKRQCGRGSTTDWKISHAELKRLQSEGLLPVRA